MITPKQIIDDIIEREGRYVDHPNDKGGATRWGITLKTLSSWRGYECTKRDVKNLDRDEAFEILYDRYYIAPNIDALPEPIQPIITDMSVNHGPRKAIEFMQEVLICNGYKVGRIDGIIGAKTTAAAKHCYSLIGDELINQIATRRLAFYQAIVENDPTQLDFYDGWKARALSFMTG